MKPGQRIAMFGADLGAALRKTARRALVTVVFPLLAIAPMAWTAAAHAVTYTPSAYSYTVPAGVMRVKVQVAGGGGVTGGRGHVITATLNVTPGQVISGTVGAGGIRGAQNTAAPGGARGSGSGAAGGASGATGYSGSGGGGGAKTLACFCSTRPANACRPAGLRRGHRAAVRQSIQ